MKKIIFGLMASIVCLSLLASCGGNSSNSSSENGEQGGFRKKELKTPEYKSFTDPETKLEGVQSVDGKIIWPAEYHSVSIRGRYFVLQKEQRGNFSLYEMKKPIFTDEPLISLKTDQIGEYLHAEIYRKSNFDPEVYWFADEKKEIKIPEGCVARLTDGGLLLITKSLGRGIKPQYGLIDRKGKIIEPLSEEKIYVLEDSYIKGNAKGAKFYTLKGKFKADATEQQINRYVR